MPAPTGIALLLEAASNLWERARPRRGQHMRNHVQPRCAIEKYCAKIEKYSKNYSDKISPFSFF